MWSIVGGAARFHRVDFEKKLAIQPASSYFGKIVGTG
jgi:hypothetical protein